MAPCAARRTSRNETGGIVDAAVFAASFRPETSGRPRRLYGGCVCVDSVRQMEARDIPKSSGQPMVPGLLPPDQGGNPLERIAALRAAHPGDLGTAASTGGNGVSALADAAVEHRKKSSDALAHGEMPYGKEGLVRDTQGLTMDDLSLTVRHVDLPGWRTIPRRETGVSVR